MIMGIFDSLAGGFGLGDSVHSMLNPDEGYRAAADQMRKAWEQAQGFQDPYRKAGLDQTGRLNDAENKLLDPSALLADWMSKYQTSPFAQKSMANAKESGLDAASSMGLMGSSSALNNIQNSSSDIMNADRSQYLNDMMQKFMGGIGIGQNMFNTGAATAGNMGKEALGVGENLGQAAYGEKNAPGQFLKDMLAMGAKAWMGS
jgi:hypothetical protein